MLTAPDIIADLRRESARIRDLHYASTTRMAVADKLETLAHLYDHGCLATKDDTDADSQE